MYASFRCASVFPCIPLLWRALTAAGPQVENAIKLCKNFRPAGWDASKVLEEVKQKKPADAAKKDKPKRPAGRR